nr:immunoglobulin heavy chain junction region [Macaca mulatta]MOV51448.1 immunoglobulin heavy chain junction region [Macaca mulatta]MOV51588.1 immunoglobulin heavy chain junction region [Macaca mulatta]MOV52443.1 immunoglobulin heavy chain junction region [Macaca mulatta]
CASPPYGSFPRGYFEFW